LLQTIDNLQQENQLQEQLTQTTNQYGETVRNILGKGLAEQDLSVGQQKAQQIAQATEQYDTQMTQLQNQLAELKAQTDAKQALFNLTQATNQLEATKLAIMEQQTGLAVQQVEAQETYLATLQVQGTAITGGAAEPGITTAIAPTVTAGMSQATAAQIASIVNLPQGSTALQSLGAAASAVAAGVNAPTTPTIAPVTIQQVNVTVPPAADPATYTEAVRQGLQNALLNVQALNSGVVAPSGT